MELLLFILVLVFGSLLTYIVAERVSGDKTLALILAAIIAFLIVAPRGLD